MKTKWWHLSYVIISTSERSQMVFLKKCHAHIILMPNKKNHRQNKTEMDVTSRLNTNFGWSLKFESTGKFTALLYAVTDIHVQWSTFSSEDIWTYTRHEKFLWPLFALNIYYYTIHTQESGPQKSLFQCAMHALYSLQIYIAPYSMFAQ